MGIVRRPLSVKLFIGLLAANESVMGKCEILLSDRFGPIDLQGPIVPWNHSDYYSRELGPVILRKFVFFRDVIEPDSLPSIKLISNALETGSATRDPGTAQRVINIDPGYLTEAKVILASTKDYAHRIYLGQGIYGEVELRYNKDIRTYLPFEHTYPDFRSETTVQLLLRARQLLQRAIREEIDTRHRQP